MFKLRHRAPSPSEDEMPPLKRVKRHPSPVPQAPRGLTASIKRKTRSSAKLAKPGSVFGVFSRPHRPQAASRQAEQICKSFADASANPTEPAQNKSFFNMFSGLSLNRSKHRDHQFMSGGRSPHCENHSGSTGDPTAVPTPVDRPPTLLKTARSRMTLKSRQEPSSLPMGKIFGQKSFRGPNAMERGRAVVQISFRDLDPATQVDRQRDSGYASGDWQGKTVNRSFESLVPTALAVSKPESVPHSSPIDIPPAKASFPDAHPERHVHSPESVERMINEELPFELAEISVLSASPPETLVERAAIRPGSLRQQVHFPDPIGFEGRELETVSPNIPGSLRIRNNVGRDYYPSFLAGQEVNANVHKSDACYEQRGLKTPRDETTSSHEMGESDYARCVSQSSSLCPSICAHCCEKNAVGRRSIDIRTRRRDTMSTHRNLAMDAAHGHIRSTTATAAEGQSSRRKMRDSEDSFSEVDPGTLKAIINLPNGSAERMKRILSAQVD